MTAYTPCMIKSFKHDGNIHRIWKENWKVPASLMDEAHKRESIIITINYLTSIEEASGEEWISKVPAVSFFIPGQWYNIVALIEQTGVRFYCNVASPPYEHNGLITYIDYDIDIILTTDGRTKIVDLDEYEWHKRKYRYDQVVQNEIENGLASLKERIKMNRPPFDDVNKVLEYFERWKNA